MPRMLSDPISLTAPTPLLGGLSPRQFMRRHWQKRPLLVRQAWPGVQAPLSRTELFGMVQREDVEARLVRQDGERWSLRRGPMSRRALPPVARPGWTLLVQGLDRHVASAEALLSRFRFAPAARLDDLMLSWASDGGGVGPHVDSYDVFLLQVEGRRRWRIAPPGDEGLRPGLPLKILANFEPSEEWVLEPGDLLYLPPGWQHEGVAVGACMTASIGFRAPERVGLARELLGRLADAESTLPERLYRDGGQAATATPGRVPAALQRFAQSAVAALAADRRALHVAFGEWLSEPVNDACFEVKDASTVTLAQGVYLDAASRMLYDDAHVFLNGESWRASGRDAALMRHLADRRALDATALAGASAAARELLEQWVSDGWLHATGDGDG